MPGRCEGTRSVASLRSGLRYLGILQRGTEHQPRIGYLSQSGPEKIVACRPGHPRRRGFHQNRQAGAQEQGCRAQGGEGRKSAAKKTRKRRRTGKDCQPAAAPEESNLAEVLPRLAVVCIVSVVGAWIIAYVFSALLQYLPLLQISFGKSMS